MRVLFLVLLLFVTSLINSQIINENLIGGGMAMTILPKDSALSLGIHVTLGNRLEFYKIGENIAFDLHTNIKFQVNYPRTYAYGLELLMGIDLNRSTKNNTRYSINYSWGYLFMDYRSRGDGNIFTLKGFNFHQLYIHGVWDGKSEYPPGGILFEYYRGINDEQFFSIGVVSTKLWLNKKRK